MKKDGFTMVELIAIITILAVIILIALPSVVKIRRNAEEKIYNDFLNDLYIKTENYVITNGDLFENLNTVNNKAYVQVKDLINAGYINKDVVNPKTEQVISDKNTIIVKKEKDETFSYVYLEDDYTNFGYNQNGLMLQYDGYSKPINNSWMDFSDNETNAILVNMNDNWTGDSLDFDGVDDSLSLGSKLQNIYNSSMTFEIVLNADSTKEKGVILGNYPISNNVNIERNDTQVRFWFNNGNINKYSSDGYFLLDQPATYTFVFDKNGNQFKYYRNQALVGKFIVSFSTNVNFVNALIGNDNRSDLNGSLNGEVHAVRVYNRVLSEKEISNNYRIDKVKYELGD